MDSTSTTENDLDQMFQNSVELKKKQGSKLTEGQFEAIRASLLDHQKEAVCWMHSRETRPDGGNLPTFYERRQEGRAQVYYNTVTMSSSPQKPMNVKGGILADDMGLGKTLAVLTLIQIRKEEESRRGVQSLPTLVVCPLSVIQNWEKQGKAVPFSLLHWSSLWLIFLHSLSGGPSL